MKTILTFSFLCLLAQTAFSQSFQFGGNLFVSTNYFYNTEAETIRSLGFNPTMTYRGGAGLNARINNKNNTFFVDLSLNYQTRKIAYQLPRLANQIIRTEMDIVFDEYTTSIKGGFPFKKVYPFIGFSLGRGILSGYSASSSSTNGGSITGMPTLPNFGIEEITYFQPYIDLGVESTDLELVEKLTSKFFVQLQLAPRKAFETPIELEVETGSSLVSDDIQGYFHALIFGLAFYI